MKRLSNELMQFLHSQGCVIVSTIDQDGSPHSSCKGIVKIDSAGRIYLLDLYRQKTYANLKRDHRISITAIDEHRFKGYCLKGKARTLSEVKFEPAIIKAWEDRITSRLTQRVIRNMREEKGHPRHPEALLPNPQYLIAMEVGEIIDLTPHHLKHEVF